MDETKGKQPVSLISFIPYNTKVLIKGEYEESISKLLLINKDEGIKPKSLRVIGKGQNVNFVKIHDYPVLNTHASRQYIEVKGNDLTLVKVKKEVDRNFSPGDHDKMKFMSTTMKKIVEYFIVDEYDIVGIDTDPITEEDKNQLSLPIGELDIVK